jgi:hypothetical protein
MIGASLPTPQKVNERSDLNETIEAGNVLDGR